MALWLQVDRGGLCGDCIGSTLASDEPVSVETSHSVEERVILRISKGLLKWKKNKNKPPHTPILQSKVEVKTCRT